MNQKKAMGKSQRDKGLRGEREVVLFWRKLFPDAERHLEYQANKAKEGIDIVLEKDRLECQVKIGNTVPKKIYDFIGQMNYKEQAFRFVQCRRDREDWLVILRAEDFKELVGLVKENISLGTEEGGER